MAEDCPKQDAWMAQAERNIRYDRTLEKIQEHMERQTIVMEKLAVVGEQIVALQVTTTNHTTHINTLFARSRDQEKQCASIHMQLNERLYERDLEPSKDAAKEKLRFSTAAWILALSVVLTTLVNSAGAVLRHLIASGGK